MRELLFSGELIYAGRAKEIGLVNRVVAPDDLMSEAKKFAASVLQGAPGALAQTKRLVEELWWHSVKGDIDLALKYHMGVRPGLDCALLCGGHCRVAHLASRRFSRGAWGIDAVSSAACIECAMELVVLRLASRCVGLR